MKPKERPPLAERLVKALEDLREYARSDESLKLPLFPLIEPSRLRKWSPFAPVAGTVRPNSLGFWRSA